MITKLPNSDEFISISDTAKFLNVSIDTIRRWDKVGKLKSFRLDGKNRYFKFSEIIKFKYSKPLSIAQVVKKTGLSQSTLRRYEKRGIIKPSRGSNNKRLYTIKDVKKLSEFTHQNKTYSPKVKNYHSIKAFPKFVAVISLFIIISAAIYNKYYPTLKINNYSSNRGLVAGLAQESTSIAKVTLYNGTDTSGLTDDFKAKLQNDYKNIEIVDQKNANSGGYRNSIIVNVNNSSDFNDLIDELIKKYDLQKSQIPVGEVLPQDSDILIIIGRDQAITKPSPTPSTINSEE
jgi:DNA-binding transcriptional MerR regulator